MTNSLNWEIVNRIKRSPDPFSCDFLNLPNKEFSYLFDLLDAPISSAINKLTEQESAELISNPPEKSMFTDRLWLKLMDKDIFVTKETIEQKLKITEQ